MAMQSLKFSNPDDYAHIVSNGYSQTPKSGDIFVQLGTIGRGSEVKGEGN